MNQEVLRAIRDFIARPAADLMWIVVLTFVSCYGYVTIGHGPVQVVHICLAVATAWGLVRMFGHPSVFSFLLVASSIAIALMGYGGNLRIFGTFLGSLWIIIMVHIAAGEFTVLATALYAVAPGEDQKITDTPFGKIFRTAESATFWIVVVAVPYGIFAPYVPWQYGAIAIVLLLLLAIGNAAREKPSDTAFEKTYEYTGWALAVVIALGIFAGLQLLGIVPGNNALMKGVQEFLYPPDQCAIDRDAAKNDIHQGLADNEAWRSKNASWLAAGSPLAKEYFARYESGQAMLNQQLVAADEKYKSCKNAKSGWPSASGLGWLHAILYEWHWAISIFVLPTVLAFVLVIVTWGKILKSDVAREYAKGIAFVWAILVIILRAAA